LHSKEGSGHLAQAGQAGHGSCLGQAAPIGHTGQTGGTTSDFKIYNGGPVEQDNLYFIHNIPDLIPNSIEISNGIFWGGDFEFTKELINTGVIKKKNIRFFLGYTGWDSKQLENEMQANSWILIKNTYKNKILGKASVHFWKEKILELGGVYLIWSNAPENPILN
jgi:putative transcriptional regulator